MKPKHTPGPWAFCPWCGTDNGSAIGSDPLATCCDAYDIGAASGQVAPEMLDALKCALVAVEYFDEREGASVLLDDIRSIIRKATGEGA